MYGLTDNIVAGPAGHTLAAPAGSFMAGPAGHVTPAPAGQTPVYPVTNALPYIGAGHVPIDTTIARIPYAASAGSSMNYMSMATNAPIPGPSVYIQPTPATQGAVSPSGIGVSGGIGGGFSGGGGFGGFAAGGGGVAGIAGGGGAGGLSAASGNAAPAGVSAIGGSGGVSASTSTAPPSGTSNPGAPPSQGAGMISMAYAGAGFPPMELRVGQAMAQTTAGMPPTPGTEGFTVSPGGRVVPSPVGFVQPGPASRFHGPRNAHTAHHPMRQDAHVTHDEAYQPYKASSVWEPRQAAASLPFLEADYVKPSAYEVPHVIFPEERPSAMTLVEGSVRPTNTFNDVRNISISQDYSQPVTLNVERSLVEERNLTLDNSITKALSYSFPENRQSSTSVDLSVTVNADNSVNSQNTVQNVIEAPARILNLVFADAPAAAPAAVILGGPIMARVA